MTTRNLSMTGVLRAFVEAADAEEGSKIAEELRTLIHKSLQAQPAQVKRYWKIPEWFEVLIQLQGVDKVEQSWSHVEPLCSRWHLTKTQDELNAVWSYEIEGEVVHPKVRWLSVNFFPK